MRLMILLVSVLAACGSCGSAQVKAEERAVVPCLEQIAARAADQLLGSGAGSANRAVLAIELASDEVACILKAGASAHASAGSAGSSSGG